MTTITNDMRGQITTAVLKHAFKDRFLEMIEIERKLGAELYDMTYDAKDIAAMEHLEGRFKHCTVTKSGWNCNVNGASIRIGRTTGYNRKSPDLAYLLPEHQDHAWMVPHGFNSKSTDHTFEEGNPFGEEIMAYAMLVDALSKDVAARRTEVQAVLSDIRTDKQLREKWPAVLPIAAEFVKIAPKVQLPMVQLDGLNDALGLPPMAEAA